MGETIVSTFQKMHSNLNFLTRAAIFALRFLNFPDHPPKVEEDLATPHYKSRLINEVKNKE